MPDLRKMNFNPPKLDSKVITRGELTRRIETGKKVVFICAPAGYGKTTAAALWALSGKRVVKWFDLGESDTALEMDLTCISNLVLDGFRAEEHVAFAERLLQKSSAQKLVIISRNPPPTRLNELLVKNTAYLIGMDELRLKRREMRELLDKYSIAASEFTLDAFEERTAGWPALIMSVIVFGKLYIGFSMREKIDFCTGKYFDGHICELAETEKSFLLKTALTDYLDYTCASEDALSHLSKKTGFLLSDENGENKYHPLFKDYLNRELGRDKSIDKELLFSKAAEISLYRNSPKTALELAIKSGSAQTVEKALKSVCDFQKPRLSAEELYLTACGIERRLSAENIAKMPIASTVCMWKSIAEGKSAKTPLVNPLLSFMLNMPFYHRALYPCTGETAEIDRLLQRVRVQLEPLFGEDYPTLEQLITCGFLFEKNDLEEASKALTALEASIQYAPPMLVLYFWLLKSEVLRLQGKHEYALESLKTVEETVSISGLDNTLPIVYAFKTKAALYIGDYEAASEWLDTYAADTTSALRLYNFFQYLTTARALIVTGSLDEALSFLDKLLVFSEYCQRPAYTVEIMTLLAACKWFIGKKDSSFENTAVIAGKLGLVNVVAAEGKDIIPILEFTQNRMRLGLCQKGIDRRFLKQTYINSIIVSRWSNGLFGNIMKKQVKLSEKQLWVLKLLALNLTYEKIADEMGIKITTVRDHISKLYEKLGVNNSKDAIIKGRELKLIR